MGAEPGRRSRVGFWGDERLAFESNRARGSAPSARLLASPLAATPASLRAPGLRAFVAARALLTLVFVVYIAGVGLSALGLKPLADSAASALILAVSGLAALLSTRARFDTLGVPRSEPTTTPTPSVPLQRSLRAVCWGVLGTGLLLSLAAWLLAWWLPVGAYDALGYRLPAVAQWLDAGAVSWVVGDDPLRNGYPLGLEVVEAVVFSALGSARAVDCMATPLVLAGAATLAGFARQLGVQRAPAALVAGLFLLVPMHLLNAPSGYADAAFAGVLVTFLVAVARWSAASDAAPSVLPAPTDLRSHRREHVSTDGTLRAATSAAVDNVAARIDLGLSACLAVALKPHGLAFVGLGLALGLGLRTRSLGIRRAVGEFALSTLLLVPGLFFTVRNLVMTGNPLYPLEVRLGGHLLLRGEGSLDGILTPEFNVPAELLPLPAVLRPLWVWLQPHGPATAFDDRLAGLGYAFLLVGLPTLVWALRGFFTREPAPVLARAPEDAVRRGSARLPTLRPEALHSMRVVGGLTFVCCLLQPLAFWPRFTSWLWGAAALSIGLMVSALVEEGRGKSALTIAFAVALLALPEALYALSHVKRIDQLGTAMFDQDPVTTLSRVAGVDAGFVRRVLLGKANVCRTPWRLGTDDANLDGVAAQLLPRPRVHVLKQTNFSELIATARARGCDRLIVIGDNPVLASAPPSWAERIETATAFGTCHLVPVLSAEVTP